jgi:hypothetical protein
MSHHGLLIPGSIGNSVFSEITRNFRPTLRASKRSLGERHPFTTACLHASLFPSDRMSFKMVWSQFETLSPEHRTNFLQSLRSGAY